MTTCPGTLLLDENMPKKVLYYLPTSKYMLQWSVDTLMRIQLSGRGIKERGKDSL